MHFTKISKPKKSAVYSTYWKFAVKRNETFINKQTSLIGPWSDDDIINEHRFTNIFRASDRVSQYLIKLQYQEPADIKEVFFKTMLFKFFNKIETYEFLEKELGIINSETFSFERIDSLLYKLKEIESIYSGAYIIPSAGNFFGFKYKHTNHLALLAKMMDDKLYIKIAECEKLEDIYKLIIEYPSLGSFLAFQYTIDLNYSNISNFSEMDFVIAGPGAKSGIMKCFDSLGDYNFNDIIKLMAEEQEMQCDNLGLELPTLWGRKLQLIDCQNLFCEVDKYLRVSNPDVGGPNARKRIKQKYLKPKGSINLFFPPKWDINHKIEQ